MVTILHKVLSLGPYLTMVSVQNITVKQIELHYHIDYNNITLSLDNINVDNSPFVEITPCLACTKHAKVYTQIIMNTTPTAIISICAICANNMTLPPCVTIRLEEVK